MSDLFTLCMLILLQAVLGFDNLLYISLESKNAPPEKREAVRKWGIGIAVVLRLMLLGVLMQFIRYVQDPWLEINTKFLAGSFNLHSIIVLLGGIFIVYTATKEIFHMMALEVADHDVKKPRSVT